LTIREFIAEVSDTLFPPLCLACSELLLGGRETIFCPDCLSQINFLSGSRCPVCGEHFPDSPSENHICGHCLTHPPWFFSARAATTYDGRILKAIHRFKYGRKITIGRALAFFLAGYSFDDLDFSRFDAVMPVPLHLGRLRKRGFNQALILARGLGEKYGMTLDFRSLKRIRPTVTQTGLNRKERLENISGAFQVEYPERIHGKYLLLVDDVYTTGATVNECAKTLIRAGAKQVVVLTLARVSEDKEKS